MICADFDTSHISLPIAEPPAFNTLQHYFIAVSAGAPTRAGQHCLRCIGKVCNHIVLSTANRTATTHLISIRQNRPGALHPHSILLLWSQWSLYPYRYAFTLTRMHTYSARQSLDMAQQKFITSNVVIMISQSLLPVPPIQVCEMRPSFHPFLSPPPPPNTRRPLGQMISP